MMAKLPISMSGLKQPLARAFLDSKLQQLGQLWQWQAPHAVTVRPEHAKVIGKDEFIAYKELRLGKRTKL